MTWSINVTSAPAASPVSTADAKSHLRVDYADDDALIDSLVLAATDWAQEFTSRSFITQTVELKLDDWPGLTKAILMPRPPLQSVTSIQYIDVDGNNQTLPASEYVVDASGDIGRIYPAYAGNWPDAREILNAITITYVAGYGNAASDVPASIIAAIKLAVGHLYERREDTSVTSISQIPMGAKALLQPYRIVWRGLDGGFHSPPFSV